MGAAILGPLSTTREWLTAHRRTFPLVCDQWRSDLRVWARCNCFWPSNSIGGVFMDAPALLRCDNTDANGTIARGSNKAVMGRSIASVFWNNAAVA